MCAEQRKISNVTLTGKYHWPYVKGWLILNIFLTLLVEAFALGCFHLVQVSNPQASVGSFVMLSALVASLVIVGLTARGTLWAHRIAGVHLRTESVFTQISEGDRSVRLRYRGSDQLEDVEEAFDRMMDAVDKGLTPPSEVTDEKEESAQAAERRSWKSMQMTSRYHLQYMAVWLLISLGLLTAAYTLGLLFFYLLHYLGPGDGMNLTLVYLGTTVLALVAGVAIIWKGFKTAHRLAGVHIRLISTFERVARGERGVTLRFRAHDHLDSLEKAFQNMMLSLESKTPPEV